MEQLGLYPLLASADWYTNTTQAAPTLHQFKNALASMTALMYWGGTHLSLTVIVSLCLIEHQQLPICREIVGLQM